MHDQVIGVMEPAESWFKSKGWTLLSHQRDTWRAYSEGMHGVLNAPTGSGKTYSLLLPGILNHQDLMEGSGPVIIWITPIRALAKEIKQAAEKALQGMSIDWSVGARTGDTKTTERKKQWKESPEILITTPESLHILLATQGYPAFFSRLSLFVVDEWHELMGSKRGVQVELALSRIKALRPKLRIWGISATIGNLKEGMDILLGPDMPKEKKALIKSDIQKSIEVVSLYPETLDKFPWSGHIGLRLLEKVIPVIEESESTLIFTNTRGQCEIWYQKILDAHPEYAGVTAMHHGSISREIREWVEDALYEGRLKAVICTSSLDLGVDFRPVDSIIQIGGPKGVARFMQRAGRSGHSPLATSKIYFVPTHAMEFIEAAALRSSTQRALVERRIPYIRSFDVLVQYLMTLACSEGFQSEQTLKEVQATFCYSSITPEEWAWVIQFLQFGGSSLGAYDEYQRLGFAGGSYRVLNKRIAQRHKMSIGTITSEVMVNVKFTSGRRVGTVEEWFVSQFKPGDHFWFAGRSLQLVRVKDMTAFVKKSNKKTGAIPSYLGGRLALSSEMSEVLKEKIYEYVRGDRASAEMSFLSPLLDFQQERSYLPQQNEILVEYFSTQEGHHLLIYPFEGRQVHEALGALLAYRLGQHKPITFSIAMNDYGVELLSDQKMDVDTYLTPEIFSPRKLLEDIQGSVNAIEVSKRRFRDIAKISGLIFEGYPGQKKKERHLQNSSQLLFDIFRDYEPDNLLYLQAIEESMTFQFEEERLRRVLLQLQSMKIVIRKPEKPTPFSFPLLVDRLRETMTTERLEDRIKKMTLEFE